MCLSDPMATGGTPDISSSRRHTSPLVRVISASAVITPTPSDHAATGGNSPEMSSLQALQSRRQAGLTLTSSVGVVNELSLPTRMTADGASNSLSPNQLPVGAVLASSNSPVLPHTKHSGGRMSGVKKIFLRIPSSSPGTGMETEPVMTSRARLSRMLKHKVRFRRKNRSDKHYHSDDGYTSDPGQVRGEEEDETDGEPVLSAEARRMHQVKELERKVEKARAQLQEEEEICHEYKNEYVQEMESTMNDKAQLKIKARYQSRQGNYKEKSEKLKKKIEKLDEQLRHLKESPVADTHTWREKGMASIREIGGKLYNAGSKLRKRRYKGDSGNPTEAIQGEVEDEEDVEEAKLILLDSDETTEVDPSSQMTLKEGVERTVYQALEPEQDLDPDTDQPASVLLKQKCFEDQLEELKKQLLDLREQTEFLQDKLESERDRAERLETQVNDMTELHQHEISELRAQLNQMDNVTLTKSQDLEDAVEECRSKVDRLDVYIQRLVDSGDRPAVSVFRTPLANVLSVLLVVVSLLLAMSQRITAAIRTPVGALLTVSIILAWLLWCHVSV